MKKISIISVLLFSSVLTFSQVQKGSMLVGTSIGSIGYNSSDSKTSYSNTTTTYDSKGTSASINVGPSVAWFIQDNLALGGEISLSFYSSSSKSSNSVSTATSKYTSTQPSFYIGPMARYYFGGSDKGKPFAELDLAYQFYGGKSKSSSSSGSSSETLTKPKGDYRVGIAFGYEHFITQNVGIFATIGVSYYKDKTDYEYTPSTGTGYTYTSDYSGFNIPVSLGLQVHILGKAEK
jgi:hypothetical protein